MVRRTAAGLGVIVIAAACVRTPHATTATPTVSPSTETVSRAATGDPNVAFVRGMIAHHRQALVMTALVSSRASRADLRLLAERIEVSQKDEIATLQRWLARRGHDTSATVDHAHHGGNTDVMPGMLSADELGRLASARAAAFDRLFLEYMIKHHEGALVMVKTLFASPGAAQEPELFGIASEVDADQRTEIARMRRMLPPS
jgi:uncharacterized protein (DUF305 family)